MQVKVGKILKENGNSLSFVVIILLFQLFTDIVVALNIAFARQVIAFVYLTFILGLIVLKALKWDRKHFSEVILFAIGLDIALIMFIGLVIDVLLPLFGMSAPLTTFNLLVAMNIVVVLSCLAIVIRGDSSKINLKAFGWRAVLLAAIPILAIYGALTVNNNGSNAILLVMLATIAGLIIATTMSKKLVPERFYPIILLVIAIALVFHSSLSTNYILGFDIHSEYHVFKQTDNAAYWDPQFSSLDDRINKGNNMLSSTIYPTVYSKIADIDSTWLMKILFPLLLSFLPLALYSLYSLKFRKEVAFLGAAFVVVNLAFFGTDGFPTKQMVGELFFVLLFLVLLSKEIGRNERTLLFIVFSASLIVSHYSMAYIFLFVVSVTWVTLYIIRKLKMSSEVSCQIPLTFIAFFFVLTFGWYIFTTAATSFDALTQVSGRIARNFMSDFLNPVARSETVLRGLGGGEAVSFAHLIGRIWFYLAELLIVLGVTMMVVKKKFSKFGREYAIFSLISFSILVMAIIIPNFAAYFRMERFYQISTLFLAPFFVLGGITVFNFLTRRKNKALALNLILVVLVPFFLFESGLIYEVTGDVSYSIPLSRYKWDLNTKYERVVDGKEVAAAVWLKAESASSDSLIYSDYISFYKVLTSYGSFSSEKTHELLNKTRFGNDTAYIFMREVNTIEGIMISLDYSAWNVSDIQPTLNNQNVIYSNRDDVIFFVQGKTTPTK